MFRKLAFGLIVVQLVSSIAFAQNPSSKLYHDLLKLQETKRVLFVAAHPDDENTRLISYLANGEHAQVAYLSLTRGDGGQNLIGKELGIPLGLIRTHELLKARETDGGRQFFSRALDFGFSKIPDETLNNWDKEKLLADVIWVIRSFQPDIIINRFNLIPGTTHGHHTTSAMLSYEAFDLAGDPKSFSNQLSKVKIWNPKRLFWNAYSWGGQYEASEDKKYHIFPVGDYNPLLGTTYSQIAADSRTMHKSQGFGSTPQIGMGQDHIEQLKGDTFKDDPFEGVESKWSQVPNGKVIQDKLTATLQNFDFINVSNNIEALLEIKKLIDSNAENEIWYLEKKEAINQLILDALGVKAEFNVNKEIAYSGETIAGEIIFNNPSQISVELLKATHQLFNVDFNTSTKPNQPITRPVSIKIPKDYPVSQPFWLEKPIDKNLFDISDLTKIGPPINHPSIAANLELNIQGQKIELILPLKYKYNDQVDGEINQPLTIVPEVNVSLNQSLVFLMKDQKPSIEVEVSFKQNILKGVLLLEGLDKSQYKIISEERDERRKKINFKVELIASKAEKTKVTVAYKAEDGRLYNQDINRILYKHIPNLTYFTTASFDLIKFDFTTSAQKIAYIAGAGDDVPEVLRYLGYEVNIIDNGGINKANLKLYPTVIIGIRAFNTNQSLANNVDQLMDYVKEGGNLIVQYNTSSPLLTRDLGPYPFAISRDRVTVEESPVIADYDHPILTSPIQITSKDFEDWVQERGLYFTADWDQKYTTPLEMQDPGEAPSKGALLHAKYGEGTYTYSGISWFRHLPAGVPGAIKLFVNLIEQGDGK
ncbi:PIG-L family deacetylase [Belliella kenyensis]|uniref:PIG-L family deacetylase n=1 Tax=Belliella kenyensis TaxID=1472724 RepID=A0ABV8EMU9_9BACT|nr:PIG-L family deacetylase [Belliella kenyensis]MCH7403225.1 PIG-L family deacetylase [Belliella kenyensis]MDN3604836.1 PIG-L family deacetylase [Belliella kenyensis]